MPGDPPDYAPEQEVRLAVVMYGGVSLAIYMYGVAVELWRLVRATAPERPEHVREPSADGLAFPQPESTEAVYRKLGRMLPLSRPATGDGPVRTRFVVDVISGTSAGGINGICLAKALANNTPLEPLRKIWVEEGDIGVLLNDSESSYVRSADGTTALRSEYALPGRPASLLNSRRMFGDLREALGAMNPTGDPFASPLVEELDLFVTTTDLTGRDVVLQLDLGVVHEKRHAHRSRFRYAPLEQRSDFGAPDNDFLAYAARCTSAFPFAFEPMVLSSVEPPGDWTRFYEEYRDAEPSFAERRFSDGGILDNKPFSYAIDAIGRRQGSLLVERKLVFIEPDPTAAPSTTEEEKVWNALETVQAATLGIPSVETIREDIERILERNRLVARVRDLATLVYRDAAGQAKLVALAAEQANEGWARQTLQRAVVGWGPSYGTYHRMKVRGLVDHLAETFAEAAGFDPSSDEALAVAYLVRAWKERRFDENATRGRASDNDFLIGFDNLFRARRIGFCLQKLRELSSGDAATVAAVLDVTPLPLESLPEDPNAAAMFKRLRADLHRVRRGLHDLDVSLRSRGGPLASELAATGLTRAELEAILGARHEPEMLAEAAKRVDGERLESFDRLAATVRGQLESGASVARDAIVDLLGPHTSARDPQADLWSTLQYVLRFHYDAFEAYDLVLYPLQYATPIGEGILVEVARISPAGLQRPDVPTPARRLKGIGLHHFAAFLDEGWRRNDIVWGRLNGAECLIRTFLADLPGEADALVDEAHALIIGEYEEELAAIDGRQPAPWFETAPSPNGVHTRSVVNRAAGVIGPLIQAILDARAPGGVATGADPAGASWRVVRRALDPNRDSAGAIVSVLLALASTRLAEALGALAAIGLLLLSSSDPAADVLGGVALGIVGVIALVVVGAVGYTVPKLRGAVSRRVEEAVNPKPDEAKAA